MPDIDKTDILKDFHSFLKQYSGDHKCQQGDYTTYPMPPFHRVIVHYSIQYHNGTTDDDVQHLGDDAWVQESLIHRGKDQQECPKRTHGGSCPRNVHSRVGDGEAKETHAYNNEYNRIERVRFLNKFFHFNIMIFNLYGINLI